MELNFENYTRVSTTYEGQAIERIDIPSSTVLRVLSEKYKDVHGIDSNCTAVKLSEYTKEVRKGSKRWVFDNYFAPDITKLEKLDVEYAYIEEWEELTPHGDLIRISYGGEASEEAYSVQKALDALETILK